MVRTGAVGFQELDATVDGVVLSPTQLAKLGDDFATNPVCVGPFMFDHRVAGDNVTVIKSPYYYDQKRRLPRQDRLQADARRGGRGGGAQGGRHPGARLRSSPTELPAVQQNSSLRVLQRAQLGWRGIVINIGNKNGVGNLPYTNVGTPLASSAKLRQAFEEAIDRDDAEQGRLRRPRPSRAARRSRRRTPPGTTRRRSRARRTTPQHAKKLVAASGFSNPTVHLLTPNATDQLRLAQFIQAQEAAVGINVVIDSTDAATATRAGDERELRRRHRRLEPASVDPTRQHLPVRRDLGRRGTTAATPTRGST